MLILQFMLIQLIIIVIIIIFIFCALQVIGFIFLLIQSTISGNREVRAVDSFE